MFSQMTPMMWFIGTIVSVTSFFTFKKFGYSSDHAFWFTLFILAALVAFRNLDVLHSSGNYTDTQGTITKVAVQEIRNSSDDIHAFDYLVDLEYQFTVHGETHTGKHIYAGIPNAFTSQADLEHFLKDYPVGKQTTIYYNADNPKESALHRISVQSVFIFLGVMITVILGVLFYTYQRFMVD